MTFANTTAAALETVLAHAAQLHVAQHDTLTGLPNRALLADNAERMLAAAGPPAPSCAMVLLDLNGFKNVNDTLGHAAGDKLLLEIGTRLAASVRSSATASPGSAATSSWCCSTGSERRYRRRPAGRRAGRPHQRAGHDRRAAAGRRGQRRRRDLPRGRRRPSTTCCAAPTSPCTRPSAAATASCTTTPPRTWPAPSGSGCSPTCRAPSTPTTSSTCTSSRSSTCGPASPETSRRSCAGATRRAATLSPADFVPVIEHSALIGPFTAKVLDEAVRCCVAWQTDASLHGVGVAVNLSARNLMHRDLPDEVARTLARHGLPARKLVLEITETAAMNDTEVCESVLARLRDLGVRLSVDDFGTGYASLTFLRRIDVAEVKLDRAFVADMLEDEAAATIVGATVALAHGLGLTVVAEGVETAEQLAALHLAGCDLAQGYFLSKPVPPDLLADGAESAVAKAAAAGVIEPTSRKPLPPRLPVPARHSPLARDLTR